MTKNSKMHIKIGDSVQVIAGNQKGFVGTVNSIMKKNRLYLLMELYHALNIQKPPRRRTEKSELQVPIHISNVMLWDKENNSASRISYKTVDGKKQRHFVKSGKAVA